jgi:hypothetical protein
MAPSVGIVNFTLLEGEFPLCGTTPRPIVREGVDGVAFLDTGWHGQPFTFRGTVAGTTTTAIAGIETACRNLRGTVVTVTDQFNNQWLSIMIMDSKTVSRRAIGAQAGWGSGAAYLITIEFTAYPTGFVV